MAGATITHALQAAFELHRGQTRKGTKVPYAVHPLDVLSILLKESDGHLPEHVLVAGILHDVLEETSYTREELERDFGSRVCALVVAATEPQNTPDAGRERQRETWQERKRHTVDLIRRTSDRDLLMVLLADKLANARDMHIDRSATGNDPRFWDRFNAPRDEVAWYYRELVAAFRSAGMEENRAFWLFEAMVEALFWEPPAPKV